MLRLEGLHGHFQAQLGILSRRQLILQLCHLCSQVVGCLFGHPAGSLQLVHLEGRESERWGTWVTWVTEEWGGQDPRSILG